MDSNRDVKCPHCKVRFELDLPASDGDIVPCQECGQPVEIVQKHPLVIDIPEDPLIVSRRVLFRQHY
jgi:DNA-directed RNA polymerase subunit RPC12/RpoP